ncbi:MAG: hypothetical protein IJI78_09835 [Oscillospiraceae bacterium]|nr:hypothetical protein [Oscillospiraceae bacterium]
MELITASMLEALNTEKKRQFEGLLPLIIKKLIISGTSDLTSLRIPSGNDIWANGFDGVISCVTGTAYITEGTSVWEFGTSDDSLRKIESDYAKRTKNSLGIDKSQTSLYLVSPKIWAFQKTITQWESEHTDWKAVHVYDASVLCDWINSEPTVVSWLLELLFDTTADFSGIDQAWELFSQKTNPPFSLEMFLENREKEIELLHKSLRQTVIKIKSDSFLESMGFVLGALKQNRELQEKCVVVYDSTTYQTISNLAKNKIIVLNYISSHDIVPSENSVIVCYNKEAISIKPDIQLNPYSKMHFYNAFRKMGINESAAHELYAFCHGNLRALVRRIPGTTNEHMPDWAGIEEKNLLEPIVFLRTINTSIDREIVEKIVNISFETVEEFYKALVQKEDSPIKRIENNYLIVNYEEAWSVLGCSVDDSSFARFHSSVKWLLEEIQKYGLYSGRFGQTHIIKQHVRNLMLNYVYYSFSSDDSTRITDAVTEILEYSLEKRTANLLLENMAVLAEAAPTATLAFIERTLYEESYLLSLFSTNDYPHEYTGVLSAIDELTLYRSTSIRACKVLFSLYQMDYEYKILNSPEESLLTALCLFNTEVALSIQQKRELIIFFNTKDPYHTCKLICMLLGKDSFWKSIRYGEHHYDAQEELTIQEIIETSEFIAGVAFEHLVSCGDVSALQDLLKQYHHLRPDYLGKLMQYFSAGAFIDKDLLPVVFQLKDRVYSIQKYQIETEQPYLQVLKSWENLLLSICSEEERDDWLFYKTYECPSEILLKYKDDDYYEIKEQERIIRINKLRDIYQTRGTSGIIRLIKRMENHSYWGSILAEVIYGDSLFTLVDELALDGKYALIGGMIDAISEDSARTIYSRFSSELKLSILPFISREEYWKLLETEEEKKEYWKHKDMLSFSEERYEQFLIYNPRGLLMYFYERMEKEPLARIEQAKTVINSILSNEGDFTFRVKQDEYYISEIVKRIDSLFYSDEWATATLNLYAKGFVQEMPLSGKVFFFHNPHDYIEYVSANPSRRFSEQWRFSLPANACDEYDVLVYFIETLISSNNVNLAGSIIGKIPGGEDGVRLNERIRELLEHVDNVEFDNAVLSGIINAMEVRTITDGADRKALSDKIEKDASELELFYPHGAYVLRGLSRFYMSEGRQDYIQSEISDY